MPRLQNPTKPIYITYQKLKNHKLYFLVSENSYVYHHRDGVWRIRKLNDVTSYTFKKRRDAIKARNEFNETTFKYSPHGTR